MLRVPLITLFLVAFVLIACVKSSAQETGTSTATLSSQSADSEILKLLEITKIQRDAAVEKTKLLEDRLAAKDAIIEAQKGIIDVRDQQLALAKRIDNNSLEISAVAKEQIRACELQLSRADSEIARLRNPGFFRSIFDSRSIVGAAIGFGVGRVTK